MSDVAWANEGLAANSNSNDAATTTDIRRMSALPTAKTCVTAILPEKKMRCTEYFLGGSLTARGPAPFGAALVAVHLVAASAGVVQLFTDLGEGLVVPGL